MEVCCARDCRWGWFNERPEHRSTRSHFGVLCPTPQKGIFQKYASRTNHVRTSFTSVGNKADRVGPPEPVGFTHADSHASRALYYVPCGSGGWSSGYFPNKDELIPHQSKSCRLLRTFGNSSSLKQNCHWWVEGHAFKNPFKSMAK
jgi:hypothetical protein